MAKPKLRFGLENEVILAVFLFYMAMTAVLLYVHFRKPAPQAPDPAPHPSAQP
ncbi:MAG: hypothetical protein PW734_02305 [Verrucomicrobium sp.]|nr:hypothetical protein [Verrucomicrobium sp.]